MKRALLSAALILPTAALAEDFDHVAAIRSFDAATLAAGKKLYDTHCAACHGADGNTTLNPIARRFAADELKFGSDPYSMWKTISYGNGLMFRWDAVLSPAERYQIVHYVRESLVKPKNPSQYSTPDAGYFKKLPALAAAEAKAQAEALAEGPVAEGMIDGKGGKNMIYGPAQSHSYALGKKGGRFTTEKGMAIDLPGGLTAVYDLELLGPTGFWSGDFIDPSKTHHRSHKGKDSMMPGGEILYANADDPAWAAGSPEKPVAGEQRKLHGHYLNGPQVMLSYRIDDREILELPSGATDKPLVSRSFVIAPGKTALFSLAARLEKGKAGIAKNQAILRGKDGAIRFRVDGDLAGEVFQADKEGGLWVAIPASAKPLAFTVWSSFAEDAVFPAASSQPDLAAIRSGGAPRWHQTVETEIIPGEPVEGYAADELVIPSANPWGSWMRTTALDFFSDGRMAVSTLSGDVWLVSTDGPKLTWKRFATGLYEPLGLKIVDDKVMVRGRDRITRLHDLNGDDEADYYENFFAEPGPIGAGYHAFIFELQTDAEGNFYYSKSGRSSPHKAAITRISPDGKTSEIIGGDLRHPNGMGSGGPQGWITISDNPSGKAVYNGVSLVREGGIYGYEKIRNQPMLAIIPAAADSSSGGQCWADPKRWGPLSGEMIHTTYSHCAIFYVLTQDIGEHPNGFAIPFPFELKSGAMRARVNPVDGQVHVVGQKGWDTRALFDGCLYRIRHTGSPSHLVEKAEVTSIGLRFTFTCDLDPASLESKTIEVKALPEKGMAPAGEPTVTDIRLADPKTLEIAMDGLEEFSVASRSESKDGGEQIQIAPPISVQLHVRAADGAEIKQTVFATINSVP